MRITSFTDYSLRVLIQAALRHPEKVTIDEVAKAYGISRNHLIKVINELARAGFIVTSAAAPAALRWRARQIASRLVRS